MWNCPNCERINRDGCAAYCECGVARSPARLAYETGRARYWRTDSGYLATKPDGNAPDKGAGGYARLGELMRLKGEPERFIFQAELGECSPYARNLAQRGDVLATARELDRLQAKLRTYQTALERLAADGSRIAGAAISEGNRP